MYLIKSFFNVGSYESHRSLNEAAMWRKEQPLSIEGREAKTIEVKTANQGSAKNKNRKASGLFVWLLIDWKFDPCFLNHAKQVGICLYRNMYNACELKNGDAHVPWLPYLSNTIGNCW